MRNNAVKLLRIKWMAILLAITAICCCIAICGTPHSTYAFDSSDINSNVVPMAETSAANEDAFDINALTFIDTVVEYDGEAHSIEVEGMPEWLIATYEFKGQVNGEVDEMIDVDVYTVTATFTHENPDYGVIPSMSAILEITKAVVALPTFSGGLDYTGETIIPKADNFDGFISGIMGIVEDKTFGEVSVGKYKAVVELTDTDHYEWAKSSAKSNTKINTVSVNGNAVIALTDSIQLSANEVAVEWSIGKATIKATRKAGAMPVFTSPSYKGLMDEVIQYKYYTDKECTQEISADEIAGGQTYYVIASLADSDNFELDATATKLVGTAFDYKTPQPELGIGDKILAFLKTYWLWLVIGVAALLVLIVLIVLISKRKKKGDNKGNQPVYPNNGGMPPYSPYGGGQPPYGARSPYGGQAPYYDRANPQQPYNNYNQAPMMQDGMQPQNIQYAEGKSITALGAPKGSGLPESGAQLQGSLVEEIYRLRGEVESIKTKSAEEASKLRAEVEHAKAASAVESIKMQAMAEIERAKNEAKFSMHSNETHTAVSEVAATTTTKNNTTGNALGDALMSAVAKMLVEGSVQSVANNIASTAVNSVPVNNAQPIIDNSNMQPSVNALPQCPPGARMTTTTTVDMSNSGAPNNNTVISNGGRTSPRSVNTGNGVNGNPFEVNGLYEKYYDEHSGSEIILTPRDRWF